MKFHPIPSTLGHYAVSRCGRVRRILKVRGHHSVGRDLSTRIDKYGYPQVALCINGKERAYTIHRLVAEVFVPNPESLPQVNHKDGNKLNNTPRNLEWCNAGHNLKHARETGLWKAAKGSRVTSSKLTDEKVREILRSPKTGIALAKKYQVSVSCISMIRLRKTWKHVAF